MQGAEDQESWKNLRFSVLSNWQLDSSARIWRNWILQLEEGDRSSRTCRCVNAFFWVAFGDIDCSVSETYLSELCTFVSPRRSGDRRRNGSCGEKLIQDCFSTCNLPYLARAWPGCSPYPTALVASSKRALISLLPRHMQNVAGLSSHL